MLPITSFALAGLALTTIGPMSVVGKSDENSGDHVVPLSRPHLYSVPGPSLWRRACQPGQYLVSGTCQDCGKGYYCSGNGDRTACPAGTYNDQTTANQSSECKTVECGHHPTCDNADGTAATGQARCGPGHYSNAGSTTCTICPEGSYCDSPTTCTPKPCDPGTYADTRRNEKCKNCPAGTFNNSYGNTSCCKCCAGWYNQGNGIHTSCEKCPNTGHVQTGPVGSDDKEKCCVYRGSDGQLRPAQSCSQPQTQTPGTCPPCTGHSPSSAMKRSTMKTCPYGTTQCKIKSGRGGFECVDTLNSFETCGGCDNDCSDLKGTNEVQCVEGHCVIRSCSHGYYLTPRGDGVSRGGLDTDVQCIAKKRRRTHHASTL